MDPRIHTENSKPRNTKKAYAKVVIDHVNPKFLPSLVGRNPGSAWIFPVYTYAIWSPHFTWNKFSTQNPDFTLYPLHSVHLSLNGVSLQQGAINLPTKMSNGTTDSTQSIMSYKLTQLIDVSWLSSMMSEYDQSAEEDGDALTTLFEVWVISGRIMCLTALTQTINLKYERLIGPFDDIETAIWN